MTYKHVAPKDRASRRRSRAETDQSDAFSHPSRPGAAIQRQFGNQAVQRLVEGENLAEVLPLSHPTDPAEREAEAVTEAIVGNLSAAEPSADPSGPIIQQSGGQGSGGDPDNAIDPASVQSGLGPGTPLPTAERAAYEAELGHDFRDVRVHTGGAADAMSTWFNAEAFTVGTHIGFSQGAYDSDSTAGNRLLAHELVHVVQQDGASATPIHRATPIVTGVPNQEGAEWLKDVVFGLPGNALSILESMGLGTLRTLETYGEVGSAIWNWDASELAATGEENAQLVGSVRQLATDSGMRETVLETVTEYWLGDVYECLPPDVQRELLEELGTDSSDTVSYGVAALGIGAALQKALGESIFEIANRIFLQREITKQTLQMAASWGMTSALGGLLKLQGLFEESSRAQDRLESEEPALYERLDALGQTASYFLFESIEEEVKTEFRSVIASETGLEVPDECDREQVNPFDDVTPEELAETLEEMYGVPRPFPDLEYSLWFPDNWVLDDWEDEEARRDIEIMAEGIYFNMEAYQEDYHLGTTGDEEYGANQIDQHPENLPLEVLLTYDGYSGGSDYFEQFHAFRYALQEREIEVFGEAGHTFATQDDPLTYTLPQFAAAAEQVGLISWR